MNADAVAALRALFEDITFADRDAICVNCGSGWGEHTDACPVTVFRAALADASDDGLLWADVVKFVRWSANVRNDTAAAIDVARRLLGRIEASGSHQGTPSGSARVSEPRP